MYSLPTRNSEYLKELNIKNTLTKEECISIINIPKSFFESKINGEIFERSDFDGKKFFFKRLLYEKNTEWIFKRIQILLEHLNKNFYNFDIEEIREVYVAKFIKDSYFSSHVDIGGNISCSGRKLTMIFNLSDNSSIGGNIRPKNQNSIINEQYGDLIVIPSFLPYEITKVKRGEKFFLISYVYGPHFR